MKKVSLVLILVLVVAFSICPMAFASGEEYAKIDKDGVVFYDNDLTPLFLVTKDCYVKHLSTDNTTGYSVVSYAGKTGKIKTTDLGSMTTGTDELFGTLSDATTTARINVFPAPNSTTTYPSSLVKGTIVTPLGTYTVGQDVYVYVRIPQADAPLYGAVYLDNLNWNGVITPPQITQSGGSTTPDINEGGTGSSTPELTPQEPENNLVRILLIVGICVPALIIVYLIFKPVKPTSNRYASDNPRRRDDYEDFE